MHDSYGDSAGRERTGTTRENLERAGGRLLDYLRSRTAEHWIMFVAGLVAGLLLA